MAEIYNGRYALADPSSGLTAFSMEGGEINMFGRCTKIRTTQRESYPKIDDEPKMLKVENNIMEKLFTGLAISAVIAGVAIAVAVTGGVALAPLACALGGVAIGTGAVAIGTAVSDSQTGYNRSWEEYLENLMIGGGMGFVAGASVYGLIAAVPAVSTIAGKQASKMFETSNFTAVVVPDIMAVGRYGLAITSKVCAANNIYSNSNSYDVILDKLFNNNVDVYETTGMALDMSVKAYANFGESNQALGNRKNDSDEEGIVFERLSDYDRDENEDKKKEKKYRGFEPKRHIRQHKGKDKIFDTKPVNNDEDSLNIQDNGSAGGNVAFSTRSANGWYSDIAASTAAGNAMGEIFVSSTDDTDKEKFPDIYVYDGLPWKPDNNTYFFDLRKAREDVWLLYEGLDIAQSKVSSMLISSDVSPRQSKEVTYAGQYATVIDGIPALGVGVWPAMWKNYYPEYAMKQVKMDDISANWTYKIAIVVVDKGEDVSDSSKWKYVPATRVSSKAHTFYGGVLQTYVTLTDKGDIISTASDSGLSGNILVNNISEYKDEEDSIVQMLKDIKAVNNRLGAAWLHYVEVYNIGYDNNDNINHNYDFVGYVIYGDTFMNMN